MSWWLVRYRSSRGAIVTNGKVMEFSATEASPPRMSLMLCGSCGVAPKGKALARKPLSSSSFQTMRVPSAYPSWMLLLPG